MNIKEFEKQLAEQVEERVRDYSDINEFVNNKEEVIEVILYEFADLCDELYYGEHAHEAVKVFDYFKNNMIEIVCGNLNCNFIGD